jgi:hypothetical protein
MTEWVLLSYRVPREPTAARVYVWRRLRRLGAVLVHGAVWALPRTAATLEQLLWLAEEIAGDLNGGSTVWTARAFPACADAALERDFQDRSAAEFNRIIGAASRRSRQIEKLSRAYREACGRDYFQSPLREQARLALLAEPRRAGGRESRRSTRR